MSFGRELCFGRRLGHMLLGVEKPKLRIGVMVFVYLYSVSCKDQI